MSPGQVGAVYPLTYSFDLRWSLPTIQMPTLVLHRAGNRYVLVGNGRYLAEHIDGARFVELPGADHLFHAGDPEAMLGPVQEFLTGDEFSVCLVGNPGYGLRALPLLGSGARPFEAREAAVALAEGILLGTYRFDKYRSEQRPGRRHLRRATVAKCSSPLSV